MIEKMQVRAFASVKCWLMGANANWVTRNRGGLDRKPYTAGDRNRARKVGQTTGDRVELARKSG